MSEYNISQLDPSEYAVQNPTPSTDTSSKAPASYNLNQLSSGDYSVVNSPANAPTDNINPLLPQSTDRVQSGSDKVYEELNKLNVPGIKLGTYLGQKIDDIINGRGLSDDSSGLNSMGDPNTTGLEATADAANAALMVSAPEVDALSGIAGSAAVGAGSGALQSVAAGKDDAKSLLENTASGGIFGGLIGVGAHYLSSLGTDIANESGITSKAKSVLLNAGEDVPKLINSAIEASNNDAAMNPFETVSKDFNDVGKQLDNPDPANPGIKQQIGQKVDDLNALHGDTNLGNVPENGLTLKSGTAGIPQTDNFLQTFAKSLQSNFGWIVKGAGEGAPESLSEFMDSNDIRTPQQVAEGKEPQVTLGPDQNRPITEGNISSSDENRINTVYNKLKVLQEAPTVQNASDMVDYLDNNIKKFGSGGDYDPLQSFLKEMRHTVNSGIRDTVPEIAQANDAYQNIKQTAGEFQDAVGKNPSQVIARTVSGDQRAPVLTLLKKIEGYTGVDLASKAKVANWATDIFGDSEQRSLFAQRISQGLQDQKRGLILGTVKAAARVLGPNTQSMATALSEGRSYALGPIGDMVEKGLQDLADSGSPIISDVAGWLQKGGVSAENAKIAAQRLLKSYLIDRLAQSKNRG